MNQNYSTSTGVIITACSLETTYFQISAIPLILHPIIFLIGSDEVANFIHSPKRRRNSHTRITSRSRNEPFDSVFLDDPSSRMGGPAASMVGENDALLTSNGRRTSVKRNVCFEAEKSRSKKFFLPDLFIRNKVPQRKQTRYWKQCSSGSEPMSMFSSSSTSSINHVHQICSGPLPDASYKRDRIARRSSAFKSQSNVSAYTPSSSSGRECMPAVALTMHTADDRDTDQRRCSL